MRRGTLTCIDGIILVGIGCDAISDNELTHLGEDKIGVTTIGRCCCRID